jgi:hypothetical protein
LKETERKKARKRERKQERERKKETERKQGGDETGLDVRMSGKWKIVV